VRAVRIGSVVLVGLALAAPASAHARDLPSETPDDVAYVERVVHRIATNGPRTLLSGDFAEIGRPLFGGAIVSAATGSVRAGVELDTVAAVTAARDGGWYVASRSSVRRLRADGTFDPAFAVVAEDVRALRLSPDGATLWLAGRFDAINGTVRKGAAAVDATTGHLRAWQTVVGHEADSLAFSPDGTVVYLAGAILEPRAAVVALSAATGALLATGPPEVGNALATHGDTVYLADNWGRLRALDGATLAERWRSNAGPEPAALVVSPDGRRLFVTDPGRLGGPGLMRFDAATGARDDWTSPLTGAGPLALSPDGAIAYLGRARVPGWPARGGVAVATSDGALLGWAPGGEHDGSVDAVTLSADGASLFVDGSPTLATRFRRSTAILDETGTPTPWVEPAPGGSSAVAAAAVDAAGNAFLRRGTALSAVAPDGTLRWRRTVTGGAAMLTERDGVLYLVGAFTAIDGVARPGVAALRTADGSPVEWALSPSGGTVEGMRFSPDGRTLFVSGTFTAINGVARDGLAALDAASGALLGFAPALEGRPGSRLRMSPDGGVLYLTVTNEDDAPRSKLVGVRVSDGAVVFAPRFTEIIRGFEPLADGQSVIVASDYRDLDARPLTAWDARTSALLGWHEANCMDCMVNALELSPDGRELHVGGQISWGGRGHFYLRLGVGRVRGAPANVNPPTIVRPAASAPFAECDPGVWSSHPAAYAYSWTVDGAPAGDGHAFLLTAGEAGRSLCCEVRAGAATAVSAPWTIAPPATTFTPSPRRIGASQATPSPTPTPTPEPTVVPTPTASPAPTVVPTATSSPAPKTRVSPTNPPRIKPRDPAPRVRLTVARGAARVTLSERARVTTSLRSCTPRCRTTTRAFTLAAGRHTLTARRLAGRATLPRGRHTLTLRARDAGGNVARARATM
jgi:hypothetical protein